MARVTIEDCMCYVDSRFDLVVLASQRCRELLVAENALSSSVPGSVVSSFPVRALRDIASGSVSVDLLRRHLLNRFKVENTTDEEIEDLALQAIERELLVDDTLVAEVQEGNSFLQLNSIFEDIDISNLDDSTDVDSADKLFNGFRES